jgi:anti-anti-sigma factor
VSPAPFEVKNQTLEDGVHTFEVVGELDLNTAPDLERLLSSAMDESEDAQIVIDLSPCEFIDSTGIALIVRAWQRIDRECGEGGGRLVICCSNDQVQRLLKITGVGTSISMHPDRDSALSELRA